MALSFGQRQSLSALRDIADYLNTTQSRLNSGRTVSRVEDNPVVYFQSRQLTNRADTFSERRAEIDQAISTVQSQINALETVDELLLQLRGIAVAARTQNTQQRVESTESFLTVAQQISDVIYDASYQGINLLNDADSSLRVQLANSDSNNLIEVQGANLLATAVTAPSQFGTSSDQGGLFTTGFLSGSSPDLSAFLVVPGVGFTNDQLNSQAVAFSSFTLLDANGDGVDENIDFVDYLIEEIDGSRERLEAHVTNFGNSINLFTIRKDFSQDYEDTLRIGADKLTLADLNEEAANLTSLRVRNQIAIEGLAVAAEQQQLLLSLFRFG
ncbi:MAG: hypothetical protein K0U36_01010 [Alphaproteobacteria bacterium]|nr:hypothetical protein [Alphaproteobacteria bacterium]